MVMFHRTPTAHEIRKIGAFKKEENNEKGVQHQDFPGGRPL